jgi:peptidyl-prolyl cis-trans isomerase SurA
MFSRAKLITTSSGLEETPEVLRKVYPQALQSLINEKIQLQEAARMNIKISNDQLDEAVRSVAAKNGLDVDGLRQKLAADAVPFATLEQQIKAQIAWAKVRQAKVRNKVIIADDEVEDFVKAQSRNQVTVEYLVHEIVLPIDDPKQEQATIDLAQRLYDEIVAGKDFAAVATQFSAAGSAQNGGQIGFMSESNLPKEILAEVKKNPIGEISKPVRSVEGVFIVKATEKREVNSIAAEDEINLKKFESMLATNAKDAEVADLKTKFEGFTEVNLACNEPEEFARKNGINFEDFGNVTLSMIPPEFKEILGTLETGKFSRTIRTEGSMANFIICERIENLVPLIDDSKRDAAREALFARKYELESKKLMRDLRRRTNIEIRL